MCAQKCSYSPLDGDHVAFIPCMCLVKAPTMAAMRSKAITLMWPLGRLQRGRQREWERERGKVVENCATNTSEASRDISLCITPAACRRHDKLFPRLEIVCKVRSAIKIRGRIGRTEANWPSMAHLISHWKAIYAHASFDTELESKSHRSASNAVEWMIFASAMIKVSEKESE